MYRKILNIYKSSPIISPPTHKQKVPSEYETGKYVNNHMMKKILGGFYIGFKAK